MWGFRSYVPAKTPGTMKPGTTPENAPLSDLLKMPPPHKAPGFQEVPFHIRWPAGKPSSTPMLQWIEDIGRLMTDEEEEEVETRMRTAAAARRSPVGSPRMVSPEDIDDELLGLGSSSDEKLLAEALGVGTALVPEKKAGPAKGKKGWTADKGRGAKAKGVSAGDDGLFGDGNSRRCFCPARSLATERSTRISEFNSYLCPPPPCDVLRLRPLRREFGGEVQRRRAPGRGAWRDGL